MSEQKYNTMGNRNLKQSDGLQPKADVPQTFRAHEIRAMLEVAPLIERAWIWGGLNLAVLYGFSLIIVALLLALIYGWLSRGGDEG